MPINSGLLHFLSKCPIELSSWDMMTFVSWIFYVSMIRTSPNKPFSIRHTSAWKFFSENLNYLVFLIASVWLGWWLMWNPAADGYQNEYLHVGNAYDLWSALSDGDIWHMHWYMYTGYWPWGFYAVPWPIMLIFGMGKTQLVFGNLIFLGLIFNEVAKSCMQADNWDLDKLSKLNFYFFQYYENTES